LGKASWLIDRKLNPRQPDQAARRKAKAIASRRWKMGHSRLSWATGNGITGRPVRIAFDAKPMPLFETIISGWSRGSLGVASSRATQRPKSEVSDRGGKRGQVINAVDDPKQTARRAFGDLCCLVTTAVRSRQPAPLALFQDFDDSSIKFES
jgi:hypothetical protein